MIEGAEFLHISNFDITGNTLGDSALIYLRDIEKLNMKDMSIQDN